MKKHDACRAAIVAAIPALVRDPAKLKIYIDKGRVVSRPTPTLGFEWRYRMRLLFVEFAGNPDDIMVPLLVWARSAQPDLFGDFDREDSAIAFQVDILDSGEADVLVEFELSEAVAVERTDTGGYALTHLSEPVAAETPVGTGAPLAEAATRGPEVR